MQAFLSLPQIPDVLLLQPSLLVLQHELVLLLPLKLLSHVLRQLYSLHYLLVLLVLLLEILCLLLDRVLYLLLPLCLDDLVHIKSILVGPLQLLALLLLLLVPAVEEVLCVPRLPVLRVHHLLRHVVVVESGLSGLPGHVEGVKALGFGQALL